MVKKSIITILLLSCITGCGKGEIESIEKNLASSEVKQTHPTEGLEFIKNEQGFIVHMKDIKVLLKHLSDSINKLDWDSIKHDTKKLKNSSPVAFTGSNKEDMPVEFMNLDVKFHMSALELISCSTGK